MVRLLTRGHGRHAGLVRGGQGPKLRTVYQIGNRLTVTWKARLAEHLGGIAGELLRGHAARFIDDPARLACLAPPAPLGEASLPQPAPAASLRRTAGNCRRRVPVSLTCCSGSLHYHGHAARLPRRRTQRGSILIGYS